MNETLKRLCDAGLKESRVILGLMSGTSLDGLDIALCRISGHGNFTKVNLLEFETIPYTDELRNDIKEVFSKETVSLEKLTLLNAIIGDLHGGYVNECLTKWKIAIQEIDCIASHGQTVYHAPRRLHSRPNYPNATLQIGDGDHLAVKTGLVTLSDFRQKHVAAGGEGAPLALYGDRILFSSPTENRILLNIGGISNFSYLPCGEEGTIVSTDCGPGNTLIDRLSQVFFNRPYDEDGAIARKGTVNKRLLEALLSHPFFEQSLPKSTGPELFNMDFVEDAKQNAGIGDIAPEDLINTLTHFTAQAIADAISQVSEATNPGVYISGGGCHNSFMVELISRFLPGFKVKKTKELGVDPDAKEAILFALLANETICGSAVDIGYGPKVTMGKISLPD